MLHPEPIGSSLDGIKKQIRDHVSNNRPVLLLGETGTGKSMLSRWAGEKEGSEVFEFSCVDTGDELFRSAVFGHEKGAFTGANETRKGLVEEAGQNVLFLDEIGDLPKTTQSALLRLVENRKYRRLGSNKDKNAHCKFIAATNQEDNLRQDLKARFYEVRIPPLFERKRDLLEIIQNRLIALKFDLISELTLFLVLDYGWPMNTRELFKEIELVRESGNQFEVTMLPTRIFNMNTFLTFSGYPNILSGSAIKYVAINDGNFIDNAINIYTAYQMKFPIFPYASMQGHRGSIVMALFHDYKQEMKEAGHDESVTINNFMTRWKYIANMIRVLPKDKIIPLWLMGHAEQCSTWGEVSDKSGMDEKTIRTYRNKFNFIKIGK